MPTERPALVEDLELIIEITRAQRHQLALWSPVYFNPRDGADEAHAGFLSFLVGSDDHETLVLEDNKGPFGFYVRIQQQDHLWIDDLCVTNPARWPDAVSVLSGAAVAPWVTCVSVRDEERLEALMHVGLHTVSTYLARQMSAGRSPVQVGITSFDVSTDPRLGARHTFGGRTFAPDAPGALIVGTGDGYVVGSPSVSPPIYDPGGTTCVVDQVVGRDRMALLEQAVAVAAQRGDSQMIVVSAERDRELKEILSAAGFKEEVVLIGS